MTSFSQLQFYSTPLAERMLAHERNWLAQQIRTCVGSHAAIVSSDPYARINDLFSDFYVAASASSDWRDKNAVCCDASALPFSNTSLDVLVLQHVTDGTTQTLQILREAERVLVPGGRLLLLAENPFSLFGIVRRIHSDSGRPHSYRKGLVKQWLSALDIQVQSSQMMLHELPINNHTLLSKTFNAAAWAAQQSLPFGGVYGFSAIKSARPVNPLRWKKITWQAGAIRPVAAQHTVQNKYEQH